MIQDKTKVKSVLVLGKPMEVLTNLETLYDNQILTLTDILNKDRKGPKVHSSPQCICDYVLNTAKNTHFKPWTAYVDSGGTSLADYILVLMEPMYLLPIDTADDKPVKGPIKKKVLKARALPTEQMTNLAVSMPIYVASISPSPQGPPLPVPVMTAKQAGKRSTVAKKTSTSSASTTTASSHF